MTNRGTAGSLVLALAAIGVGCGGSEKAIVARYFGALNSGDNQTLSSFAAVRPEEKVDAWQLESASPEQSAPASLPELTARHAALEAELDENKKAANAYALDRLDEVDQVRELLKDEKRIPSRLQDVADTWQQYNEKDRELKIKVGHAKNEMDTEHGIVRLSVGDVAGVESMPGQMLTKTVDLSLTIGGEPRPYLMTLRRYALEQGEGGSRISRWVVYDLKPRN